MTLDTKVSLGLTQFIEYTLKGSGAQANTVRKIKYQDDYHPAFDYWKTLRDAIVRFHSENLQEQFLYEIVEGTDLKKQENYKSALKQYIKFLKKKEIEWFNPGKAFWSIDELSVRSSPELGLFINGEPHLIKLYFKGKKEKIDKRLCKDTLTLMQNSKFTINHPTDIRYSILNINTAKLITKTTFNPDDFITLESQAVQFMYIWNKI